MIERSEMYSWMNPALVVRQSVLGGSGVFAEATVPQCATLIVMGGRIIDIEAENRLDAWQLDKPIEISEEFAFCPKSPAEMDAMPQHYVNHSCNPNAGFSFSNFLVAMRDIEAGEEITYDYAMVLAANPKSQNTFQLNCQCGAAQCRGIVGEDDWQRLDLQERYAGYFQPWIQVKISAFQRADTSYAPSSRIQPDR